LIGKDNAEELAERMANSGLSVRQAESLTKKAPLKSAVDNTEHDKEIASLGSLLSHKLKLKVAIDHQQVTIRYKTLEELDTVVQLLSR
jgi:hypothetical protein